MRAFFLTAVLAVASGVAASGCDFTPVLDVDTPDFVPGFVLSGALLADSTVSVFVGAASDPYGPEAVAPVPGVVTLWRGGQLVETLERTRCLHTYGPPEDCGLYTGATVIEAAASYTVRVEADGMPTAEARVDVPRRAALTATAKPDADGDHVTFTLDDPAGADHYYLDAVRDYQQTVYIDDGTGPPVQQTATFTARLSFSTTEPLLVAAARATTDGIHFVLFDDRTFDGTRWSARVTVRPFVFPGDGPDALRQPRRLRLFTVDAIAAESFLEQAYSLSGDAENPFAEPGDGPSNVSGGYGLVAGVALAEVLLPDAP